MTLDPAGSRPLLRSSYASADRAHGDATADPVGLKALLDTATGNLDHAQKAYDEATTIYKPPKWPDKIQPILPAAIPPV